MNDFTYYNPVCIHFGKNALDELGEAIAPYAGPVLLVYGGGSIKRTGLYDRVMKILREAGRDVVELGGVMPNPRTEKVYEGIELCRKHNVGLILAVGGGSAIDCAKAVAVGAKTDKDFWQTFYVDAERATAAIPLGTVLTIPATGSEMDSSSVITNWAAGEKRGYDGDPLIYPKFSILDPTITYTLPKNQMAYGIVDTMSHLFELYFSAPDRENVTDDLAEGLMHALIRAAREAMADPQDYDARADLMWTSSVALCGMAGNGKDNDWASHNIEHAISALFDVPHGAGLAVVHPNYLEYIRPYATGKLARFARRIWGVEATLSEDEQAAEGIRRTRAFFHELGAPVTLAELGVSAAEIDRIAAATDLSAWSYKQLTQEDVKAILRMAQ